MSTQRFCHHCGKPVNIGAKFCGECGTNLLSLANAPADKASPAQFTPFAVASDDDDGDGYLDKLTRAPVRQNELQVEIVRDRPLGESVGALMSQAMQGSGPPVIDPARPAQFTDAQQFLSDFKKEAGTSREKSQH